MTPSFAAADPGDRIDLVLHRPAGCSLLRWEQVLTNLFSARRLPDLSAYVIGTEAAQLTLRVGPDRPAEALSWNLAILATACSALRAPPPPHDPSSSVGHCQDIATKP